jgi:serine/threonine protein kinase
MSLDRMGRFEILGEIGLGGMGKVYQALDPQHDRQVAIKALPQQYLTDLGFRARFEREARLIADLEHAAILPVYEFGEQDGQPYLVMQYMPNGSLADRLLRGPLSLEECDRVLGRIAAALDYAHEQGIIHRDLKASNILFDQDDNAYLADFGIALQPEATWQRDLASGTPAYMSPEQALRVATIDARSDVYALGVITYEMLAGELPFDGETPVSILLKHIHDPPPSLVARDPDLPGGLDAILQRALAKDPQERYPSAGEFAKAFQNALRQPETEAPAAGLPASSKTVQDQVEAPTSFQDGPVRQPAAGPGPSKRPAFPDLADWIAKRRQPPRPTSWRERYVFALGLVTWLAVLLAVTTAAFARNQELVPPPNLQLIYNDASIAVVNVFDSSVNLAAVTFQRLSDQGMITAEFSAEQWRKVGSSSQAVLPPGTCYQLVRPDGENLPLSPGEAPGKPSACEVSQGWLVAFDEGWDFWTANGQASRFRVVQNDRLIQTCRIPAGKCQFHLPEIGTGPGS